MAKIKLNIDALEVESFETDLGSGPRGTVQGLSGEPEPGDAAFIPTTDWKTCQGGNCTPNTICHNSCLGECHADDTVIVGGGWV